MGDLIRCFGDGDPLMARYHDEEWGVPVHADQRLFEHLILDMFQAGLSWRTILYKRESFRNAFHDFDPQKIAGYSDKDRKRLMADAGIIRNRAKIDAAINNAQGVLELLPEFGTFDAYIWRFTDGRVFKGPPAKSWEQIPTQSPESEAMSKDLKERGFKFVGPTICYAFMQAVGIVDDHLSSCFRYQPGR